MPSRQIVEAFIAAVEKGAFIEAIENFYAPDATIQENQDPPRGGRDVLIAGERQTIAMFASIQTRKVERWLIDGDLVVINWVFRFTLHDGKSMTLDELALQRWSGDRIGTEQFYYDPEQRRFA